MKKNLIIVSLVLIAAIVIAFLTRPTTETKNDSTNATNQHAPDAVQNDSVEVSNEWKRFVFQGDIRNYYHTIEVSYPVNWFFQCCGDTDTTSTHLITPFEETANENIVNTNKPYVVVTEYSLVLCDDGTSECEINNLNLVSATSFFNFKENDFTKNYRYDFYSDIKKSGTIKLTDFKTDVQIYTGTYRERPVRAYLINTGKGVVLISFVDYEKLPENFESDFLEHLEPLK
jgi:hypothetical protein